MNDYTNSNFPESTKAQTLPPGLPAVQIDKGYGTDATMPSPEIATLTGKRHHHVMRDIKTMLEALDLPATNFGGYYIGENGKELPCFHLPRDLTMTLVTGYSIPLRKKVIDRLDEIEGALRNRPVLDFSDPKVLLGVLNHLQCQIEAKDVVIADQSQRLTKLDRIEGAVDNLVITDAAKVLKVKPKFLRTFLQENRWIYKRPKSRHWLAYQALMPKYLDHRDHTFKDDDGDVHFSTYAVVTPAGMVKLAAMLDEHFAEKGEVR
ncbi:MULTISPECIES: phage regulatory protein/antirepressor Ant [unclassified Chelatococcus]|uniref:phage antirepressor KilAC domain-containing protein n=1 Tax=unclassified Chelatococcus TaxID=2638111 RepID=UPI001BCE35F8|nr:MULTISPECIES: phage regulatory protein/antirepressor Ant [unclassified Chelatococcus]MBS7696289.1 phage regulatory protein/antirepressor Ant [Chelatococcus sp. YT9]MBX3556898.1 phage regulatory protein/antirepressor Ant [Chelatococcus sp.]